MSRDLSITRNRSKLIIVAAAGTLSLATAASAASAAAAAWPAVAPPQAAFSVITARSGQAAAGQLAGRDDLAGRRIRFAAEHQGLTVLAARQAAAHAAHLAHLAAVAQAAKRKAQARWAWRAARSRLPAASSPAPASSGSRQAVASGSPQLIARRMLGSFGWPGSEFGCLDPLWAAESGWSVTATNPSTGAYGIPQAMPGSKMASAGGDWQTDAATQIRWGLGYIRGSYGTVCAAWRHEQAYGWY